MSIIHAILLIILAPALASGQSAVSPQAAEFTLEITSHVEQAHSNVWDFTNEAERVVKPGETVVIALRKINISGHEIAKRSDPNSAWGLQYDVRDSIGNPVAHNPPRTPGGFIVGPGPQPVVDPESATMKPDEARVRSIYLSEGYDISKPGTYTVQISQHISEDPKSDVVKSNIITIKVVPAKDSPAQR